MEPPSALDAQSIRDEKVKVLRALAAAHAARRSRRIDGARPVRRRASATASRCKGYRQEEGVDPQSHTETYVALRVRIDNWRWAGVPFFLRTGKRLAKRVSEIAVQFKQPPLHLFRDIETDGETAPPPDPHVQRARPAHPAGRGHQPLVRLQAAGHAHPARGGEHGLLLRRGVPAALAGGVRAPAARRAPRRRVAVHALRRGRVRLAVHHLDPRGLGRLPAPKFPNYYPFSDGPDEASRLFEGTDSRWRSLRDA